MSTSVCARVCTQAQLASWSRAIRWGHVKKRQGDRYSSSVLLQWSSNTRSPEAALQHGCCVFVISLLEGGSHAAWARQSTAKLRQGGKDICLACNSDEWAMKCFYQCLYFMALRQIIYQNKTIQEENRHSWLQSNQIRNHMFQHYVIVSNTVLILVVKEINIEHWRWWDSLVPGLASDTSTSGPVAWDRDW